MKRGGWARHVAFMVGMRNIYTSYIENMKENDHWGTKGIWMGNSKNSFGEITM
jgi:hypothetical protein